MKKIKMKKKCLEFSETQNKHIKFVYVFHGGGVSDTCRSFNKFYWQKFTTVFPQFMLIFKVSADFHKEARESVCNDYLLLTLGLRGKSGNGLWKELFQCHYEWDKRFILH